MSGQRLRVLAVVVVTVWVSYYAVGNCFSAETRLASPLIPDQSMRLGLDLRIVPTK